MSRFDTITNIHEDPSKYKSKTIYNIVIKRFLDFLFAAIGLLLLSPVYIIIALLVKHDSPGRVLYQGIRTGYHGREFRVFKFRSMVEGAEELGGGTTAHNDKRITTIGRFLRKTKLDETPQLLNILLGHMSFVGPRPELPRYTNLYQGYEKIILDVRPGITDLSSIHFIHLEEMVSEASADEQYEREILKTKNVLRVQYVVKQSVFLDMWLLFETVRRVIKKTFHFVMKTQEEDYARECDTKKV